jgi:hypothetical protein
VRALLPRNFVCPAEADVVALSSSDTEEALELLSLSPARGPASRFGTLLWLRQRSVRRLA